jgi:hypothetical protein
LTKDAAPEPEIGQGSAADVAEKEKAREALGPAGGVGPEAGGLLAALESSAEALDRVLASL